MNDLNENEGHKFIFIICQNVSWRGELETLENKLIIYDFLYIPLFVVRKGTAFSLFALGIFITLKLLKLLFGLF